MSSFLCQYIGFFPSISFPWSFVCSSPVMFAHICSPRVPDYPECNLEGDRGSLWIRAAAGGSSSTCEVELASG
jgi:hypothetical protein